MKLYIVSSLLLISGAMHGYRRFTYVHHHYTLPVEDTSTLLNRVVCVHDGPSRKPGCYVTYCFERDKGRRDYVELSRMDIHRLQSCLRAYSRETQLTADLKAAVIAKLSGKRKVVVEHVLNDFMRSDSVTIGEIINTLHLNKL